MTTTPIGSLQVRDDFMVTIAGTVIGLREDEFLLQDSTGQIWVDAVRGGSGTTNLTVGEPVTVLGDLDDLEDFDAIQIIRSDGSTVIGTPNPNSPDRGRPGNGRPGNGRPDDDRHDDRPNLDLEAAPRVNIGSLRVREDVLVKITGTVTRIREDEFLLRDRTGRVWVDGIRKGNRTLDIAVGDRLTVVGDLDDEDFDALRITRANGAIVANSPTRLVRRQQDDFQLAPQEGDFGSPPPWAGRSSGSRFGSSGDLLSAQEFAVDSSIF